jgi:predicted transcriptional regulator
MFTRRSTTNALPQLGELELNVLEILWAHPELGARDIREQLNAARKPRLSTVQSTLERLWRKELLSREREGTAYVYRCRVARSELLAKLMGGVIRQLHTGSLDPILSSFVDFADRMDENTLDKLDALVQQRKQQREQRDD